MCTVSFIARRRGYLLAMNRDERLTRASGLPPKIISSSGRKVICPSEPGGGTWIAVNDAGVTYALINWYSVKGQINRNPGSRGQVVDCVNAQISSDAASEILASLSLKQINPFRLIGIFPTTREVFVWSWNLKCLVKKNHPWHTRQFISSGFDEPTAQRMRSITFGLALSQRSAGTFGWLHRLHCSHSPTRGPFSTCMHRADAATVSCTQIIVSLRDARLCYLAGAPCEGRKPPFHSLKLVETIVCRS